MSTDFLLLLLVAAASAYGARATLQKAPLRWTTMFSLLLWTFTGAQTALLLALTGDGRLVPGFQMNPAVKAHWGNVLAEGRLPTPDPALCLLALLAHLLAVLPRAQGRPLLRPLPATIVFVVLFFALRDRAQSPDVTYERAFGPDGQAAYLTIVPGRRQVRLVLAVGGEESAFLKVRLVRETEEVPAEVRLLWTKDGDGIVLSTRNRRIFATDREGAEVGVLPEAAHEWPRANRDDESAVARRSLTQAERDVAEFIIRHGDLYAR